MASPSSSLVSSNADRAGDDPDAPRRTAPARPRTRPRCLSCRPRRGRTEGHRAPSGTNGSLAQASRGPRRHHVGMAEQHQHRPPPPCVAHRLSTSPKRRCSTAKAGALQSGADQRQAAGVVRGDRGPQDAVPSPAAALRSRSPPNSFLKVLSVKPCDTAPSSVTTTGGGSAADTRAAAISIRRRDAGRLAVRRQVAPGGRGLVDHQVPTADLLLPVAISVSGATAAGRGNRRTRARCRNALSQLRAFLQVSQF